MPFQPVTAGVQVLMNFRQFNQQLQNQYYVRSIVPPTVLDLVAIFNAFSGWWQSEIAPFVSSTVTLDNIVVTDVSVFGGAQYINTFSPSPAGSLVVPAMPSGTTVAVSWRTGLSGRNFRGRTYHIGLVESQVTDNQVTNATLADLEPAYFALVSALNVAGFPLSVCSRVLNGVPRPSGILTPILTVGINPDIDSQRRRLTGRGR